MRWLAIATLLCLVGASAFGFTKEEASKGRLLFAQHCAVCHGAGGGGGSVPEQFAGLAGLHAPQLIGKGALVRFPTAGDVLAFAASNMPAQAPGSLKEPQYLEVVSYLLEANGLQSDGQPLTPGRANRISLEGLRQG